MDWLTKFSLFCLLLHAANADGPIATTPKVKADCPGGVKPLYVKMEHPKDFTAVNHVELIDQSDWTVVANKQACFKQCDLVDCAALGYLYATRQCSVAAGWEWTGKTRPCDLTYKHNPYVPTYYISTTEVDESTRHCFRPDEADRFLSPWAFQGKDPKTTTVSTPATSSSSHPPDDKNPPGSKDHSDEDESHTSSAPPTSVPSSVSDSPSSKTAAPPTTSTVGSDVSPGHSSPQTTAHSDEAATTESAGGQKDTTKDQQETTTTTTRASEKDTTGTTADYTQYNCSIAMDGRVVGMMDGGKVAAKTLEEALLGFTSPSIDTIAESEATQSTSAATESGHGRIVFQAEPNCSLKAIAKTGDSIDLGHNYDFPRLDQIEEFTCSCSDGLSPSTDSATSSSSTENASTGQSSTPAELSTTTSTTTDGTTTTVPTTTTTPQTTTTTAPTTTTTTVRLAGVITVNGVRTEIPCEGSFGVDFKLPKLLSTDSVSVTTTSNSMITIEFKEIVKGTTWEMYGSADSVKGITENVDMSSVIEISNVFPVCN